MFRKGANFSCLFVVIAGNLFVESIISFVNTIGGAIHEERRFVDRRGGGQQTADHFPVQFCKYGDRSAFVE
jgi:hypothetical protein